MKWNEKAWGGGKLLIATLILSGLSIFILVGCNAAGQTSGGETFPSSVAAGATQAASEPGTSVPPITLDPGEIDRVVPPEPETTEGEEIAMPMEAQVIRVHVRNGTLEALIAKYRDSEADRRTQVLIQATDRQSLDAFLAEANMEELSKACEGYDEAYFAENDLLIVPRVTNTGSARHSVELVQEENDVLAVVITVETPEYATADMGYWFLLVPAEKSETQGKTCVARLKSSLPDLGGALDFFYPEPSERIVLPTVGPVKE